MSYVPGRWVDHPIEADGRRLIFYVEPAYDAGFDVVVCENLADGEARNRRGRVYKTSRSVNRLPTF